MATDYDLYLTTHLKPSQAMEQIASQFPELAWGEGRFFLFNESASINAAELRERSQNFIRENFSFTPAITVGFRQVNNGDWELFREILLQSTLMLLSQSRDAVLLLNGEHVILQRFGGRLAFNADSGLWRDEDWLRRKVQAPFELRPLPSPLL